MLIFSKSEQKKTIKQIDRPIVLYNPQCKFLFTCGSHNSYYAKSSLNAKTVPMTAPKEKKLDIYTIKDKVAEEFGPLFSAKNDLVAIRMSRQIVTKQSAPDMLLYRVGTWNNNNGQLTAETNPILVSSELTPLE
nr:MAG: nonstructural protein [Microvirus sp.]